MKSRAATPGTILASLVLCCATAPAHALEWAATPSITAGSEYNDNFNLSSTSPESLWGLRVTPQVNLGISAPAWGLDGVARISRAEYPDNSAHNRTDQFVSLTPHARSERDTWSLGSSWTHDTTLETELDLTGIVLVRAPRDAYNLTPSWTRTLTETDQLNLSWGYDDVTYDSGTNANLFDYTNHSPSVTLTHFFSEQDQLSFSLGYNDYETKDAATLFTSRYHYQTRSAQAGYTHVFTDTLRGSVVAGLRNTDSEIEMLLCGPGCLFVYPVTARDSSSGTLFNANLVKSFETSTLTTNLSRSLMPTGNGGVTQNDRLTLSYDRTFSDTLNGTMSLDFYGTQSIDTSNNSVSRRYYTLRPKLNWKITEWWGLSAEYIRAKHQFDNGSNIQRNVVNLTVRYTWPKMAVSR